MRLLKIVGNVKNEIKLRGQPDMEHRLVKFYLLKLSKSILLQNVGLL